MSRSLAGTTAKTRWTGRDCEEAGRDNSYPIPASALVMWVYASVYEEAKGVLVPSIHPLSCLRDFRSLVIVRRSGTMQVQEADSEREKVSPTFSFTHTHTHSHTLSLTHSHHTSDVRQSG